MSNITRRSLLTVPVLAPLAKGGSARSLGQAAGKGELSPREKIRRRYFPDVTLITHEGKKVRFYEDLIKDKVVVINMMYAECEGVCLGITSNLVRVQKLFGDQVGRDLFFYSITLKPEKDDQAALKHYA